MKRYILHCISAFLCLAIIFLSCKKEEEVTSIELLSIENITSTSATVVYKIRSNKKTGSVRARAACSTTPNPTVGGIRSGGITIATMSSFNADGTFTHWDEIPYLYPPNSPEFLEPNTTYYVRAVLDPDNYDNQRSYSNQMTFTTLE